MCDYHMLDKINIIHLCIARFQLLLYVKVRQLAKDLVLLERWNEFKKSMTWTLKIQIRRSVPIKFPKIISFKWWTEATTEKDRLKAVAEKDPATP